MMMLNVVQRARGVYLASWYESEAGEEEFDAFPTAAKAREWCEKAAGDAKVQWTQRPADAAHWPSWSATVEDGEDAGGEE